MIFLSLSTSSSTGGFKSFNERKLKYLKINFIKTKKSKLDKKIEK